MTELRRPDILVVVRILGTLFLEGRAMGRTQLQLAAGTNYTQFLRYVELLRDRGLIELTESDGSRTEVRLTPRGYAAFQFLSRGLRELFGETTP